jgi:hypothetical protein
MNIEHLHRSETRLMRRASVDQRLVRNQARDVSRVLGARIRKWMPLTVSKTVFWPRTSGMSRPPEAVLAARPVRQLESRQRNQDSDLADSFNPRSASSVPKTFWALI